jgi:Generalcontrol nonderepressible 1 (Gcn1) N-terminal
MVNQKLCYSHVLERSVDIRLALTRLVERLPKTSVKLSTSIVQSLLPLFAKESNDAATAALTDALAAHEGVLLSNDVAVDDKAQKMIIAGLVDKRTKIKSGWAVAVSETIWQLDSANPSSIAFSKAIAKNLFNIFNEVTANAVQSSQNGTITAAYAISAAALGRWMEWQDAQLGTFRLPSHLTLAQLVKSEGIMNATIAVSPKVSYLLNERIYTKLTLERDQLCAITALEAGALRALSEMGSLWSLATIYFICNTALSRRVRAAAGDMLERVLGSGGPGQREKHADILVLGLEEWLRQVNCLRY